MLTQSRLKEVLNYCPDSGIFIWLHSEGGAQAGDEAGGNSGRYARITIDYIGYSAHRLAWLYIYGEFPKHQIDHINHDRFDNRIKNLRDVKEIENHKNRGINKNNTSGHNGVRWDKSRDRWMAAIIIDGKSKPIGRFYNKDEAIKARLEANQKYGFHENHGQ